MKSKRLASIIGMIVAALVIFGGLAFLTVGMRYPFSLEDEYYGTGEMNTIDYSKLQSLIDSQKSFAVFVYQPMCTASADFEEVLDQFSNDDAVGFYKIAFSDIKDTEIGESVKHYPSFMIFKKGRLMEYLDAESDEDAEYYQSVDGFKKWFTKYVRIKKVDNRQSDSVEEITEESELAKNVKLENVKREKGKVNIYFFWGNGCPHCAAEFEALNEIVKEYGDKFNLYTFETWYDDDNAELAKVFSKAADGKEAKGVPYTVIGEKSFTGFSDGYAEQFIEAITSQYQDAYDIYFDKIKDQQETK